MLPPPIRRSSLTDDFNRVCRNRTGRDLSYVEFSHPDSGKGTLYYRYISPANPGSEVDPSKEYKRSGTPSLSDVYFVPEEAAVRS